MLSQDIYFVSRTPLFNPHDLHYTGPHIPVGNPMRNHITTASRMQSDLLMKDSRISYFVHFNFFLVYFFYFFLEIIIICSNNRHRALVIGQFILPKKNKAAPGIYQITNFFLLFSWISKLSELFHILGILFSALINGIFVFFKLINKIRP